MPKYSFTTAQHTFLLREAKRLGTDEADALRILVEVAMAREPKQHRASPSSARQIFYPVPTPDSDRSFAAWLVQQARRDDGVGVAARFFSECPPEANSVKAHIARIKSRLGLPGGPDILRTTICARDLAIKAKERIPCSERLRRSGSVAGVF